MAMYCGCIDDFTPNDKAKEQMKKLGINSLTEILNAEKENNFYHYRIFLPVTEKIVPLVSVPYWSGTKDFFGYRQEFQWDLPEKEKELTPDDIACAIAALLSPYIKESPREIEEKMQYVEMD